MHYGKIKIHEIAKKLGVNSKDVLEKAQELGLDVKTHMSSVDESEAKKIEAKFSNNTTKKEVREKRDNPVIIRREVIMTDSDATKKEEIKKEQTKRDRDVGFIERQRKTDYNIVYRNKPTKPLTVSELFGKKEEPKKEPAKPVVEKPEVAEKEEKKVEVTPLEKNEEKKTKELLQSEKKKTHTAQAMIEECRDKQRQAEQERDYALSHQKKVEIPVEKPVLYQKCGNCKQTAYLKAKEKYDMQREKLAGRYKTKTAMYEALMFLLIWYSVSTTLFQMIRSKIFISDCVVFFDTIATFTQTIAGWVVLAGKNVAQISDGISNPVVAGIINWLIRILICGGCLVGVGILLAFIEIKIAGLYKKYCWDMITIMVILVSMAIAIYFGDWIKEVLPINLLFLLLFVQLVYVGIRWYVKGWRENRGYV